MRPQELHNKLFEILTEEAKEIIVLYQTKYVTNKISTDDFLKKSKNLKKYEYRENGIILSDKNLKIYFEQNKKYSFCMFTEKDNLIYRSFIIENTGMKFEIFNKDNKKVEENFVVLNRDNENNNKTLSIVLNFLHSENITGTKSEIIDMLNLTHDFSPNSDLIRVIIDQQLEYRRIIETNNKEKENKPKLPFI